MKLHQRLIPMLLIAAAALVGSCSDKTTNRINNPPAELDSGNMPTGRSYSHTFASAGTYNYFCAIHGAATMSGSVTVGGTTPDSVLVTIGPGNSYNPASTSVKVMGTVRWINTGSTHTVTSSP